ncbi:hypothetical protein K491DRAFT_710392 [Lophiostoma macrostomum CBS 122681]|uniref:Uncharacterized protein n=1 Tax=Lophiostoma macrostomum CBS 122681 TaxID=1314788 RepID=A0A6A6TQA4_9PLEO|nr:hypothetical protein K491DRAFT_710392 [Lophiostoma macrostomum CBS 122681]
MDLSRRLDLFELEGAHSDEELPDYEPQTAPDYAVEDFETPICTYHLRQGDRKTQHFVTYGPTSRSSYKIICPSSRLFSKKPDMELLRVSSGPEVEEKSVASASFDNNGPLPWRPRAHFSHTDSAGRRDLYSMESRNFSDWTIVIREEIYTWIIESRPVSLVLREKTSNLIIARFTYSSRGTMAAKGAEAGALTIYRDSISTDSDGIEKIMASLAVPMIHFKKMGRHYRNDATERSASLASEPLQMQRMSFASQRNGVIGSDLWTM